MVEAALFAGLLCVALALTTIHSASAREITPIITAGDLAGLKASVKINQIYINTFSGDGPQFIKLYNPTDMDIDMSGWKVVDDRGGVNITIPAGTVIQPNHYYLIAGEGWSENRDNLDWPLADLEVAMNMNLTDSGVQLVDADNEVVDAVGWGSPPEGFYEGTPLPNPDIGSSYKRKQEGWDTNNNSEDFLKIEFLHIIVMPIGVAGLILMPFIFLGPFLAVLWFQNRRYDRG